jgi:hypothetical protein
MERYFFTNRNGSNMGPSSKAITDSIAGEITDFSFTKFSVSAFYERR